MTIWQKIRPILSRFVRFCHISVIEAKSGSRGTTLGILWQPVSTLIFTAMLTLVFMHPKLDSHAHFYIFVLAGYILWGFISDTVVGSTSVIQRQYDFAIHNNLSLAGLFIKTLIDRVFGFSLNFAVLLVAVVLLLPQNLGIELLLLGPFFILMVITSLAIAYIVNICTIFFPDLDALFKMAIRFMFFASPVFWGAEGAITGFRAILVKYNPAAYFLSIFRQTFGIVPFDLWTWGVAITISLVVVVAGYFCYISSESFVRNLK